MFFFYQEKRGHGPSLGAPRGGSRKRKTMRRNAEAETASATAAATGDRDVTHASFRHLLPLAELAGAGFTF